MPYFVRVGVIRTNRRGVGSRGYHIYRRGRTVAHKWGQVTVQPGPKFYWSWYQEGEFRGRTVAQANAWLNAEVQRRVKREHYARLPVGQRILAKPKQQRMW